MENNNDSNNDNIITSLFFKKALNKLLENNTGIILKVDNEIKPIYPGVDMILVFKYQDNIKIINYDGDLDDGETITISFDK